MSDWVSSMSLAVFWISLGAIGYAYAGYPLALWLLARLRAPRPAPMLSDADLPSVTMIVPFHNEIQVLERKLENTRAIEYPPGRLEVLFVSDGSTDGGQELISARLDKRTALIALPVRQGKAAALNAGVARATHRILVFSDASIMLAPDALRAIVRPFQLPNVGCVSGEDTVTESGGERLYGRYELGLRRLESRLFSIVGASGSFYAQRKALCGHFLPGVAPDFLSVLRTVQHGYRAVAATGAVGTMTAVAHPGDEFRRKVRTILRGLTTLFECRSLLNPVRHPVFSFELMSHKLARWLVPFFLLTLFGANLVLAFESRLYALLLLMQVGFYAVAASSLVPRGVQATSLLVKVPVYFTTVNVATLSAWVKYVGGHRQELWSPSRR